VSEITEKKTYTLCILDKSRVKMKFEVKGTELKEALLKILEARYLGETS